MTQNRFAAPALLLLLAGVPACASTDASSLEKNPEVDAPADGKLDGVSVVDHRALEFSFDPDEEEGTYITKAEASATLSRSERIHAWEFSIGEGEASMDLSMGASRSTSQDFDPVMYLYRQTSNGSWGRYIRRNDDSPGARADHPYLSAIYETGLRSGQYRVVIKGYSASEDGAFQLYAQCEGDGCNVDQANTPCVTDGEFGSIDELDRYEVGQKTEITTRTRVNMLLNTQILTAVQNHARRLGDDADSIDSIAAVLEYVDARSLLVWNFQDTHTNKTYTAIDFAMGDTPVGSIYENLTTTIVATINDGQVINESGHDICQ